MDVEILTTQAEAQSKNSGVVGRAIASLIDAVAIMVLDCALMYALWVIGMAAGLLNADPQHWWYMLLSAPIFLVDGFSVVVAPASMAYFNIVNAISELTFSLANLFFVGAIVVNWLYHACFEGSAAKGTPGKIFMDLEVTSRNGENASFWALTLRHFAKIISVLTILGWLPIFGPDRNQALHDVLSGCKITHH